MYSDLYYYNLPWKSVRKKTSPCLLTFHSNAIAFEPPPRQATPSFPTVFLLSANYNNINLEQNKE